MLKKTHSSIAALSLRFESLSTTLAYSRRARC
eukprot:SAG11_NODE_8106_length_1059_cov_2.209375_1_plen_31_part_10